MFDLLLAKLTVCHETKSFSFSYDESCLDSNSALCDSLKHFVVEVHTGVVELLDVLYGDE